jgi:hypothetical protein
MKSLAAILDSSSGWRVFFLLFGAIAIPAFGGLAWALFFRNKPRRKHRRRHREGEYRMMNPTLDQTGGLPPVRKPENRTDQPKP